MRSNYEYKSAAKSALKDNWAIAALTAFVQTLLSAGLLLNIFVLNPLNTGFRNALRKLMHREDNDVFSGAFNIGFNDYTHKVATDLLRDVYIFLWGLLLWVPGIIKHYSYACVDYLLIDKPELSADETIHISRQMMSGHKWDLFCLDLSFIGWALICLFFTLGIGFFWLSPYVKTARAAFYEDLIAEYEAKAV